MVILISLHLLFIFKCTFLLFIQFVYATGVKPPSITCGLCKRERDMLNKSIKPLHSISDNTACCVANASAIVFHKENIELWEMRNVGGG